MADLDLVLRTPGRTLLMRPDHARALVDRSFEGRRGTDTGVLGRLLGAFGRHAAADNGRDVDRTRLAQPSIAWDAEVQQGDGYAIVDGVAIVDVCGVLTQDGYYDWWDDCWFGGYAQIGAAIDMARADDRVRAIFLRVNSPGGLTEGCFDLAAVIAGGNGRAGGKPIWSHARMACSAAYAVASATDRILAPAEADVGSIGVLILHTDFSAYYEDSGIKVEAIQSGVHKTDGASWKPLADDARTHLQAVVDQVARRFFLTVSAGRGLDTEAVRGLEAQWFLASHDDPAQSGLALGLVDAIATEAAAFAALKSSLGAAGAPPAGQGASGSRADNTETEMSLQEQVEALRAKAASGDTSALAELNRLGIAPKAAAAHEGEDDEDEDEDGEEKKDGDGEDADDEGDGEAEKQGAEPAAKATGRRAGFALLRSTAARGREKLATRLAEKITAGRLSYGEAKNMLADAPRGSRLGNAMSGKDRNPGNEAGEGSKAGAGLAAAVDRMIAKTAAR